MPSKPQEGFYGFEEAKEVVKELEIKRARHYHKRCFEDPRLPYRPQSAYKEQWSGWPDFLGRPNHEDS